MTGNPTPPIVDTAAPSASPAPPAFGAGAVGQPQQQPYGDQLQQQFQQPQPPQQPQQPQQPNFGGNFNQLQQFLPAPQFHQPSNIGRDTGKMFIGGLNWDTTEEGLKAYFSKFGEVVDHTIMRDNNTGKSRGFGFLTFADPKLVEDVIKQDHILDGKLIDPKRAIAKDEQDRIGKIFVGGIDPMVNEEEFHQFFSQFGLIIDAQLMVDKDTGRLRGFGFITYDSPDAVDRVTVNKYLTLKGKLMEVKRAEPRGGHGHTPYHQQQQQQQQQYNQGFAINGMQFPGMGAYPQGVSPEMMQEYWQRMQQWYMYQQQQAAAGGDGQTGDAQEQPLNPQQQEEGHQGQAPSASAYSDQQGNNDSSDSGRNNNAQQSRGGFGNDRYGGARGARRDPPRDYQLGSRDRDRDRGGPPKGPRSGRPLGPRGGRSRSRRSGGGGGDRDRDRDRRGYHPYRK